MYRKCLFGLLALAAFAASANACYPGGVNGFGINNFNSKNDVSFECCSKKESKVVQACAFFFFSFLPVVRKWN